jgi:hypothetical protein
MAKISRKATGISLFQNGLSAALARSRFWAFIEMTSFLLMGLALLRPLVLNPSGAAFHPRNQYSDLLISHLPNAAFIRDSLFRYGQIPLWNTQIMAGQPFDGDPLAGLWYPPNLLLLILPLPLAFNLLFLAHFSWAGFGMYRFLRDHELRIGPAFFGAVVFAGTPKLLAHLGAGHVSLVFAVSWTPWLLLALKRAAVAGDLRHGALAGLILALIALSDPRWAFFGALVGSVFWIIRVPRPFFGQNTHDNSWVMVGFGIMILLITAVLSMPLYQFFHYSSRSALTLSEASVHSLPPIYLIGLIFPDPYGYHEWMTYLGLLPLVLAGVSLVYRQKWLASRNILFWLLVIVFAGAFSLGSNFVLFPLLFRLLPGLIFLRVPSRAWFLVALGVSVLAAFGLQALVREIETRPERRILHKRAIPYMLFGMIVLTLFDLLRVGRSLIESRPMPEPPAATQWIEARSGLFRVYSPSYSLPFPDRLQHVDGVDPLHLASLSGFMARASGLPVTQYSVTVPSYVDHDAETLAGSPDVGLLGLLNVKFVASEFPINVTGLKLVKTFGQTYIYQNDFVRPRAWIEGQGSAEVSFWSPNRIEVQADGEGLLVLSEVAYPGWVCWVDGKRAAIQTVYGLLRGVQLPEGSHGVVFAYRPWPVYVGGALTLLGLIAFAGIWRWSK